MDRSLEYLDRADSVMLPDCTSCDTANSLEFEYAGGRGSAWCVCKSCSKRCLVKDGRVVYPPTSKIDALGRVMTDP